MKSIADVVSASGLSGYAEVALIIFFAVFVVVGLRVFTTHRQVLDHAAHLPLEDDAPIPASHDFPSTPRQPSAPQTRQPARP